MLLGWRGWSNPEFSLDKCEFPIVPCSSNVNKTHDITIPAKPCRENQKIHGVGAKSGVPRYESSFMVWDTRIQNNNGAIPHYAHPVMKSLGVHFKSRIISRHREYQHLNHLSLRTLLRSKRATYPRQGNLSVLAKQITLHWWSFLFRKFFLNWRFIKMFIKK